MPTSKFATSGALGVALGQVFTPDTDIINNEYPNLALGTRVTATDSSVWVQVVLGTGGVTGDGYVCVYDEDHVATMVSESNEPYGMPIGVALCGAAIIADYVWLQVAGPCEAIQVAASADPNVDLVATATAGELDDDVTTGIFAKGLVLTTARGGTAGTAPGMLNFPMFDTLYEPET